MGVDCNILIPSDARARDIVTVLGAIVGCPVTKHTFGMGNGKESYAAKVSDRHIEIENPDSPLLVGSPTIDIYKRTIDGVAHHHVMLHTESHHGLYKVMCPKSTAFWIAVGRRLVRFFGGQMVYSDCDGKVNFKCKKPRRWNDPEDGKAWRDFQDAILAIKPITKEDLENCAKYASYGYEEYIPDPVKEAAEDAQIKEHLDKRDEKRVAKFRGNRKPKPENVSLTGTDMPSINTHDKEDEAIVDLLSKEGE